MSLWIAISGPRPALARYGVAVGAVAIALCVRIALLHVLDLHSPFLLLFAAVMLSSAYGGLGPGILATALSAVGSLFISEEQRDFSDLGLFCLEGLFLSLLGALLHRARIRAAVADDSARRLEQKILEISEEERRRIGHDLHDGLGQHLTGIALLAKALKQRLEAAHQPDASEAGKIAALVNDSIGWTRDLARGLSPLAQDSGLQPALEGLAANASKLLNINCTCSGSLASEFRADGEAGLHLYRIAQEAINNSVKHGKAKNVQIALGVSNGSIQMMVMDDGAGLSAKTRSNPGLGLQIMAYRARIIGATLSVERNASGNGTVVICRAPSTVATKQEAET
jgi:signal transduction histidine kinase